MALSKDCCSANPGGSGLSTLPCSCEDCVHPHPVKISAKCGEKAVSKCPRLKPALASAPHYYLRHRSCEVCFSQENLMPCGNCWVTYYCSEEHRVSDFARHNEKCCLAVHNWFIAPRCEHAGTKHITDEKTLFKVDVTLHLFPNIDAINIAMRRLLRIYKRVRFSNPRDGLHQAISEIIPILYVRQGRYEAACDFIYDPEDLVPKKAFHVYSLTNFQPYCDLGHQVLLTLIMIKALRQFKDIENVSRALSGHVAQEIIDEISKHLGTEFLKAISGFDYLKATGSAAWRQNKILEIETLLMRLVYQASCRNEHIWKIVLDTERLSTRDKFGQFSSHELGWNINAIDRAEMVAIRQYQVWMETPGSYDILRSAMAAVEAERWVCAPKVHLTSDDQNRERWIDDQLAIWANCGLTNG